MKSTLAILAISAVLLSGLIFIPGVNMQAYSQTAAPQTSAAGKTVNLTYVAVQKNLTLPDGTKFSALTWNGTIPGPVVRLMQGDTVHLNIINPTGNTLIHSLDTHASTISAVPNFGPINPGATKNFTFVASQPGVFKLHCEGNGVLTMDQHVFSGMVTTMIVDPKGGYTGYQGINGATGAPQSVSPKAKEVVLQFSEYYLTKDGQYDANAMFNHNVSKAWINGIPFGYDPVVTKTANATPLFFKVGDHVRFFLINHGDLPVNFHIVGEMLDRVTDGSVVAGLGKQTYTVGGSNDAIVDVVFDAPGAYAFVNHDYSQLFKGQAGIIVVDGPDNAISKSLKLTDDSEPSNAIPPAGPDTIPVKTKPYQLGSFIPSTFKVGTPNQ
jgi:nitrite reductase (NO-forming)